MEELGSQIPFPPPPLSVSLFPSSPLPPSLLLFINYYLLSTQVTPDAVPGVRDTAVREKELIATLTEHGGWKTIGSN